MSLLTGCVDCNRGLPWHCSTIFLVNSGTWHTQLPSVFYQKDIIAQNPLKGAEWERMRDRQLWVWWLWAQFFETRRTDFCTDSCPKEFGDSVTLISKVHQAPVCLRWPSAGNEAALLDTCDARARVAEAQAPGMEMNVLPRFNEHCCKKWIFDIADMEVSSILMGFSSIIHPFWGTSMDGNPHMNIIWNNRNQHAGSMGSELGHLLGETCTSRCGAHVQVIYRCVLMLTFQDLCNFPFFNSTYWKQPLGIASLFLLNCVRFQWAKLYVSTYAWLRWVLPLTKAM